MGGTGERIDREGRSQPGRGGTGTADPVDAGPAYAGDRADAETLPLARLAQAPRRMRQTAACTPPALAGRRLASSRLARQLGLFACYLAAGISVNWPQVIYLAGALPSTRDAAAYV
jgi:hypothetical protein